VTGEVPSHWRKFKVVRGSSISRFITDLSLRLKQLEAIANGSSGKGVWLGGLFQPEAYVTATRQTVAHQKGWSLEQLVLDLRLEEEDNSEGFVIDGKPIHANARCEYDSS
jgi:dynein heavy chain 1